MLQVIGEIDGLAALTEFTFDAVAALEGCVEAGDGVGHQFPIRAVSSANQLMTISRGRTRWAAPLLRSAPGWLTNRYGSPSERTSQLVRGIPPGSWTQALVETKTKKLKSGLHNFRTIIP